MITYLDKAKYPFSQIIAAPVDPNLVTKINNMMLYMPPQLLGDPGIYFAIILAFVFIIVVYI